MLLEEKEACLWCGCMILNVSGAQMSITVVFQAESLKDERNCLLEATDDQTPKQKACTPQTGSHGLTKFASDDYTPRQSMRTAYTGSQARLWKTAVKSDRTFDGSTPTSSQVKRRY